MTVTIHRDNRPTASSTAIHDGGDALYIVALTAVNHGFARRLYRRQHARR